MNILDFQIISTSQQIPAQNQFQYWVNTVLTNASENSEIVIRIVDEVEMTSFNQQYRDKKGTTNILSFPFEAPEGFNSILLGDLLLCAPIIEKQALEQNKRLNHHWAHLIIHGVLHLLGYDHINEADAEEMEAKEIEILNNLAIKNPYQEELQE